MLFPHDTEVALTAAVALVNTGRDGREGPPDVAALQRLPRDAGRTVGRPCRQPELDGIRRLRLRICAAIDCDDVLVDLSKNRSRRFCGTACANRVNVIAYRTRRAMGTVLRP
jgi:predicted RNA-binding Zn ribbon-like protein